MFHVERCTSSPFVRFSIRFFFAYSLLAVFACAFSVGISEPSPLVRFCIRFVFAYAAFSAFQVAFALALAACSLFVRFSIRFFFASIPAREHIERKAATPPKHAGTGNNNRVGVG
jgi:hypothetical protein